MSGFQERLSLWAALARNVQILKAGPRINRFLLEYLGKFRVREVGGNLIVHSHLPPINSRAYKRFIGEHLLGKTEGPSHAQVGVTNACPQRCAYCYNKGRTGRVMDTGTIKRVVKELREAGVFWLGLTGGEPLLNTDLPEIVESAGPDCAVKLFTTGSTITPGLAADLKSAGLFSVSVSLDDWREGNHDLARRTPGAFREALRAIEVFRQTDGLDVGVSAVLSREMIVRDEVEELLNFLEGLGVHEAWLSEAKPSVAAFWKSELVITETERQKLVALQDRWNQDGALTVNYLGHFEGREHFGCNAGRKMIYVDAFGEVSPCVFLPLSFGNVTERPVGEIQTEMRTRFRPQESCFINRNYPLLQKRAGAQVPLGKAESEELLAEVQFGHMTKFFQMLYGH
jgi:MoaA/NifB/PqqE/SkfB family radical SAM enzyme